MEKQKFLYKKIDHKKYKYEMTENYKFKIKFQPAVAIFSMFYDFRGLSNNENVLIAKKGYQWNGASGPTIDTKNTIRASCAHDILYQMIRRKQLPLDQKDNADLVLKRLMLEDSKDENGKVSLWAKIRANYFYNAVKYFGKSSCIPGSE